MGRLVGGLVRGRKSTRREEVRFPRPVITHSKEKPSPTAGRKLRIYVLMLLHMNMNWADGAEAKVRARCFWLSCGDELHTGLLSLCCWRKRLATDL